MLGRSVAQSLLKRHARKASTGLLTKSVVAPRAVIVPSAFRVAAALGRSYSTSPMAFAGAETMSFQAETRKLLDIVTNSIYTDKEVFIRELVSNSSDALEKYRYSQVKGVTREDASGSATSLGIQIFADEEKNTLTIVDNGIGMTREELISNLGTIARSGSKQFVQEQSQAIGDAAAVAKDGIIGQFGVGFYSAFMVADRVTFESISAIGDKKASRWTSEGTGEFTMEEVEGEIEGVSAHGSRITMYLKESSKVDCIP